MKHLFFGIIALLFAFHPLAASADDDGPPKIMNKCKACHSFKEGDKHKVGPNLFGVMGRQAGTAEGYKKYRGLAGADFIWTDDAVNRWITNSKKFAIDVLGSKTTMSVKIKKEKRRVEIIEFLNTLK